MVLVRILPDRTAMVMTVTLPTFALLFCVSEFRNRTVLFWVNLVLVIYELQPSTRTPYIRGDIKSYGLPFHGLSFSTEGNGEIVRMVVGNTYAASLVSFSC